MPVNALLLASAGLAMGLFIGWHYIFVFTDPDFDSMADITYWALPVAFGIVWASMTMLYLASLIPEDEVEEDIREAEALGWLMNQTSDTQILHDALLCLLGIAGTPMRRRELLEKIRSILASLINAMIHPPEQICLLADGREDMVGSGRAYEAGHDSRLTFYVACLAELSQAVIHTRRHDHRREMRWNRWVTRLRGSWIPVNWYRILTFVPHRTLEREHRFPRIWYPWFRFQKPETLLNDLRVLTSRQDRYLSAMARAALSQLYPSYSPLHDRRLWPVRYSDQSEDSSFFTNHRVLIEFRMVTIWAIDECCWRKSLGISLRRYLYRYCDDMMKFWMERVARLEEPGKLSGGDNENVDEEVQEAAVEQVQEDRARTIRQYGTAFRAVTELGYVIIENHHDLFRTTQSGESTPMKAARCLMALSRWLNGLQPDLELELDVESYRSFTHSMISATRTYLLLAVEYYKPSSQHHSKEQTMENDENTIFVGMKHLEIPLIHPACRSWNDACVAKLAISALEAFYSIPGHAEHKLLQWNIPDLTRLVDHWKSRLAASDTTPAEQVSAVRAFARILNLDSQPANAQSIPLNLKSLLEVIDSGARPVSAGFHDALLSAVLETPVLQPLPTQSRYIDQTNPKISDPASARDYVALDLPHTTYYLELLPLYKNILDGYSPLVEAVNEPTSPIAKERIQRSLQLIDMLTKSMNLQHLPEVLYETAVYPSLLVSIAWREEGNMDESSKSISSCELAIELFARLWAISNKMDEQKGTHAEETFTTDAHLEKIANAVNWLTDCRVSMELDCISLWVNRLGSVSCSPEMPGYVRLVKALEGAVAYGAFDDPDPGVEEQRKNVFRQLSILIKSTVSQEPSSVDKEASSGTPI
ncbi:hypothetical protein FRC02_004348 [Tulasnella sp. 418]|nr:hypothetical protein FRC02_004348 [Tulasnella sp. 418]